MGGGGGEGEGRGGKTTNDTLPLEGEADRALLVLGPELVILRNGSGAILATEFVSPYHVDTGHSAVAIAILLA